MYGTIARLQVKPGLLEKFMAWGSARDANEIPGYVSQTVFQTDDDPNVLYLVIVFSDKASYVANAQSPAQDARYREMREMLATDPEWHDGEVVYAAEAVRYGL
jgi:quinol monooxygenase YgiN